MKRTLKYLSMSAIALSMLSLSSCNNDDDDPEDVHDHHEHENITKVEVTFTEDGGTAQTVEWSDADGAGGEDPTIGNIVLSANTSYSVDIEFYDISGDHEHDLTHEIEEDDDEHIVCFSSSTGNISFMRTDSDGTYEVGLSSNWTTTDAATDATLGIVLKHQPGVKDGTCEPGESDIEVEFPLTIE